MQQPCYSGVKNEIVYKMGYFVKTKLKAKLHYAEPKIEQQIRNHVKFSKFKKTQSVCKHKALKKVSKTKAVKHILQLSMFVTVNSVSMHRRNKDD